MQTQGWTNIIQVNYAPLLSTAEQPDVLYSQMCGTKDVSPLYNICCKKPELKDLEQVLFIEVLFLTIQLF